MVLKINTKGKEQLLVQGYYDHDFSAKDGVVLPSLVEAVLVEPGSDTIAIRSDVRTYVKKISGKARIDINPGSMTQIFLDGKGASVDLELGSMISASIQKVSIRHVLKSEVLDRLK
jgi:hypothetical protein